MRLLIHRDSSAKNNFQPCHATLSLSPATYRPSGRRTWSLFEYSQRDFSPVSILSTAPWPVWPSSFKRFSPFSSFCLRLWGQKSQVPASCAGWPVSRSDKPSFISLTNSAVRFPSSLRADPNRSRAARAEKKRRAGEKKNDRLYLLGMRDGLLLATHVSEKCHPYTGDTFRFCEVADKSVTCSRLTRSVNAKRGKRNMNCASLCAKNWETLRWTFVETRNRFPTSCTVHIYRTPRAIW